MTGRRFTECLRELIDRKLQYVNSPEPSWWMERNPDGVIMLSPHAARDLLQLMEQEYT